MAKVPPSLHANLKEISDLLSDWLVTDATKFLVDLSALVRVEDGEALIDDDDVEVFRGAYNGLIELLKIKSGEQPPARQRSAAPQAAAAIVDGAALRDIYTGSQKLQNVPLNEEPGTLLIQLITMLPEVRGETGEPALTLEQTIRALVVSGRLNELDEQLILSAREYDNNTRGTVINQRIFDNIERNIRTPENAIEFILEHHPSAARSRELAHLVYANILPRIGAHRLQFYRTALAYQFAFERAFSIDMTVQMPPHRLISELERIAGEAQERYPGTKIETATLLKVIARQDSSKITHTHWRILDAHELYSRSRLLKEVPFDEGAHSAALISSLIISLPLIREEVADEDLTLRDIIKALVEADVISLDDKRFELPVALYDLYDSSFAKTDDPDGYFNSLIRIRPSLRSYEDAPLSLLVRARIAAGAIAEEHRDAYLAQAEAYDEVFEKASLAVEETYPSTAAALIPEFVNIAEAVIKKFEARGRTVKVPVLEILAYLSLSGRLTGDMRPYIMAAAAADLSYAWKLSGGIAAIQDTPAREPVPVPAATTSRFDAFARHVRPFVRLAAAQDFYSLFAHELRDEDMETPGSLILKLDSIRTTLEGYEHEPFTTFVSALDEVGKLGEYAQSFMRYAAAYDLWGHSLDYIDDEDLGSPERLVKRINELRQDMPGLEHEPLATFIEALAVLEKLPDDPEAYTSAASLYDAIMTPNKKGPAGGTPPADPSGSGTLPAAPASGGGSSRAAPVVIDGFEPTLETRSVPVSQAVSSAFFMGTLFRMAAPQMPLMLPMTAILPVNPALSGVHLNT